MKIIGICLALTSIACACVHDTRHDVDEHTPATIRPHASDSEHPTHVDSNSTSSATSVSAMGGTVESSATTTSTKNPQLDSDADLTQRVRRALQDNPLLSDMAKQVSIVSTSGIVTLTGPVERAEDQEQYAVLVLEVPGVRRLDDRTTIHP